MDQPDSTHVLTQYSSEARLTGKRWFLPAEAVLNHSWFSFAVPFSSSNGLAISLSADGGFIGAVLNEADPHVRFTMLGNYGDGAEPGTKVLYGHPALAHGLLQVAVTHRDTIRDRSVHFIRHYAVDERGNAIGPSAQPLTLDVTEIGPGVELQRSPTDASRRTFLRLVRRDDQWHLWTLTLQREG